MAAAYVAPVKKSRYTRKDDVLLAKYFMDGVNNADGQAKKTSDMVFQEFAALVSLFSEWTRYCSFPAIPACPPSLERVARALPTS